MDDVAIIACGEMVKPAKRAAEILKQKEFQRSGLDMYCVKPLDEEAIRAVWREMQKQSLP